MRLLDISRVSATGLLALTLLASFANNSAYAQDCTLTKLASFDLVKDSYGNIVIPVTLNNTDRYMALDVGEANSYLFQNVTKDLDIKMHYLRGGLLYLDEVVSSVAVVASVNIGAITGKDMSFLVFSEQKYADQKLDGYIGLNILENFDVEVDYKNKKLNFFSPNRCAGKVVYWTSSYKVVPLNILADGNFIFPAQIDGHSVQVGIYGF